MENQNTPTEPFSILEISQRILSLEADVLMLRAKLSVLEKDKSKPKLGIYGTNPRKD